MRITASVTESKGQAFAVQEFELGEPRPDEVLVRIAAAGICMPLWEQGRFPVERLITTYDLDRINEAVQAAESGTVVKPVLLMR